VSEKNPSGGFSRVFGPWGFTVLFLAYGNIELFFEQSDGVENRFVRGGGVNKKFVIKISY
jgi:hypothetical protein